MRWQKINNSTYVLYVTQKKGDEIKELISNARSGDMSGGSVLVEEFFSGESVLMFAHILCAVPVYFAFAGVAEAAGACRGCERGTLSTLTYEGGEYILTVFLRQGQTPPLSM
ncbi:MAG: hypothetical protein IJ072_08295, partial [Oscillospiraceae bacterium]|nr:hypothetical protein [Oscillospiraceae bacterium]